MEKKGFRELTEIQKAAIPLIEKGENVLVISGTGFGKTEAAMLPILSKLLDLKEKGAKEGIQAIYITPLRALNRDLLLRLTFWCSELGISIDVRHGDTPQSQRRKQRDLPPQLLITTPETLSAVLIAPKLSDSLVNVRYVIIDEVHELVESKRGVQLSIALERLKEKAAGSEGQENKIQLIGLSATVGNEKEVAEFLAPGTKIVKLEFLRELDLRVESPAPAEEETGLVSVLQVTPETSAKLKRIKELVLGHKKTLLFVNTRAMAESLGSLLFQDSELKEICAVHHSSLSKESRIEAEEKFKNGSLRVLICTSSLELGIDIGEVDLVIQYVSPRQVSRLLQRVGRSGHRKHLIPKGVVLAADAVDCMESMVLARRSKMHLLEENEIPLNSLDVLAQQVAGIALDFGVVDVKKAFEIVKRAFPFRSLSFDDFLSVVEQIAAERLIYFRENLVSKNARTKLYYYENLSTIPDEKKFFVKDSETRKNVGVLHEGFVSEYIGTGSVFITRGKPWKVLSMSEQEIVVERAEGVEAAIPDWEGEEIPVVMVVAQEVAEVFSEVLAKNNPELLQKYSCSEEVANKARGFAFKQKNFFLPQPKTLFIEAYADFVLLHTFLGNRENETLAKALSSLFASSLGYPLRTRTSSYSIVFEFPSPYPAEKFRRVLLDLTPENIVSILDAAIPESSLFKYKFLHVAQLFGLVSREAELRSFSLRRLIAAQKHTPVYVEALNELYHDKLRVRQIRDFLSELQEGKIEVKVVDGKGALSPIAKGFLEFEGYSELFAPPEPTEQLLQAFKQGLLEKDAILLCTYCGKGFTRKIGDVGKKLSCPYCSSNQITLRKYEEVFNKEKKKGLRALSQEERRKYRELLRVASLVSTFGGKALVALETYGVGPETATRVLGRMHEKEEALFKDLLEAQKQFIRTKKFWRV